jgi:hypothetical protein
MSSFEQALKDKTTRIKEFPNFAELVFLYQSEAYILDDKYIKLIISPGSTLNGIGGKYK